MFNKSYDDDDNGMNYPDGSWAEGWDERSKNKSLFNKNRIYIVNLGECGDIECIWDGYDFYFNENIGNFNIKIGKPLNNKFVINSVRKM